MFKVPFEAIDFLPVNVQADLAIAVYLELLSKVKLFQVKFIEVFLELSNIDLMHFN